MKLGASRTGQASNTTVRGRIGPFDLLRAFRGHEDWKKQGFTPNLVKAEIRRKPSKIDDGTASKQGLNYTLTIERAPNIFFGRVARRRQLINKQR